MRTRTAIVATAVLIAGLAGGGLVGSAAAAPAEDPGMTASDVDLTEDAADLDPDQFEDGSSGNDGDSGGSGGCGDCGFAEE